MSHRLALLASMLLLFLSSLFTSAGARVAQETPGTVVREWTFRWPAKGEKRVLLRRFVARPGLIKRVQVVLGGNRVPGPPNTSTAGCEGTRYLASAQKSWVWDGRDVYVTLLLDPGQCRVAGTTGKARVVMTSVGT